MLSASVGKLAYMQGDFGQRLQAALVYARRDRPALARILRSPTSGAMGISVQAVGQVLNGASKTLGAENTLRAARFLGVDAFWLATGEGTMVAPPSAAEPGAVYGHRGSLDEALEQIGMALAQVPKPERDAVSQAFAGWAKDGGADHWRSMVRAVLVPDSTSRKLTGTGRT